MRFMMLLNNLSRLRSKHPSLSLTIMCGLAAGIVIAAAGLSHAETKDTPAPAETAALQGVGAIGRIEPASRVIQLSHDQGPEGARIDQLLVQEGQQVKAGDILAIFSDHERRQSELKAIQSRIKTERARLAVYQADITDAAADLKRYKPLTKTAVISKSTYDKAVIRHDKAVAVLSTAKLDIETLVTEEELATLKLQQSTLTAPMDGTVLKIHARTGERVGDNQIMEFADLGALDVVAEIYENDIPRLKTGQQATIFLTGYDKHYSGTVGDIGYLVRKNDLNDTDPLADRDNRVIEARIRLNDDAAKELQHQIYRQVQVQIQP